jgi:hypothetical protein
MPPVVRERHGSDPAAPDLHYWRDKDNHEIDFVIPRGRGVVDAIECKWNSRHFDPDNLRRFRTLHPKGANFGVSTDITQPLDRTLADLAVTFTGLDTPASKIWPQDHLTPRPDAGGVPAGSPGCEANPGSNAQTMRSPPAGGAAA